MKLLFCLTNSGRKALSMLFLSFFNNYSIDFKSREVKTITYLSLRCDSNPQPLGFETTKHLRNRMSKNTPKRL